MKRTITLTATLVLFTFLSGSFKITGVLPIGGDLPGGNVSLQNTTGNPVTLKGEKKQNGLLVMFSCNTCPYVVRNQQRTKAICRYALQNDIGVILLNSNESQRGDDDSFYAMQKYAKQQAYEWPYVVDKDNIMADSFGAKRTPECFLFNKDLKLCYKGAIDDNPGDEGNVQQPYLKQAIEAMLNGREITVKESRSVGCAIKRKDS